MAQRAGPRVAMTGVGSNPSFSEVISGNSGETGGDLTRGSVDHLASGSSLQITIHKLNGKNYLEWSQSVKLAIDGRGKLGYLTGEVKKPEATDPSFKVWRSENSLVTAWLFNSMEAAIAKPKLFLPTAKDVWDSVWETYSDLENSSQIFELKSKLWQFKQGDREVTVYYNEMVTLWQELDQCYNDVWENPNNCAQHMKRGENDRVYMFWAGVHRSLDEVKGRILGRKPLPSIREVFSEVRQEECRKRIMLGGSTPKSDPEASALVLRNSSLDSDGERKKKPWCDHCKKPWHTRETCWKIHGKPPHLKKRSDGRALQTVTESPQENQVSLSTNPFTKEQLEQLYTLFESSKFSIDSSCSLAQSANHLTTVLSSIKTYSDVSWIFDSGATDHMTGCSKLFSSYTPCARNKKIKIADGSFSAIAETGTIHISSLLILKNILHVPNLSCNLLSISKLTHENHCVAKFNSSCCEFQEAGSGRTIGTARECGGLYFFEDGTSLNNSVHKTYFESISMSSDKEIMLWHYRLGHPSFHYLRHLFPNLFINKTPSFFQCEFCILAKY